MINDAPIPWNLEMRDATLAPRTQLVATQVVAPFPAHPAQHTVGERGRLRAHLHGKPATSPEPDPSAELLAKARVRDAKYLMSE